MTGKEIKNIEEIVQNKLLKKIIKKYLKKNPWSFNNLEEEVKIEQFQF